jgi:hypothetical protein
MKTANLVEKVLRENPKARDSDKALIAFCLRELGFHFTQEQIDIFLALSFESLTRCRRKLQEEGKYQPSPEVARQRRLKSYEVQQTAPSATPDQLSRRIESPWGASHAA